MASLETRIEDLERVCPAKKPRSELSDAELADRAIALLGYVPEGHGDLLDRVHKELKRRFLNTEEGHHANT